MFTSSSCNHVLGLLIWAFFMKCHYAMSMLFTTVGAQCNIANNNPCQIFPDLCSAGGGLCVVKAPCEYQCVCPPDWRVSRDCSSSVDIGPGTVVDSLIIFPKDMLWDMNYETKPADLVSSTSMIPPTTTTRASIKIDWVGKIEPTKTDASSDLTSKAHSRHKKSKLEMTLLKSEFIKHGPILASSGSPFQS